MIIRGGQKLINAYYERQIPSHHLTTGNLAEYPNLKDLAVALVNGLGCHIRFLANYDEQVLAMPYLVPLSEQDHDKHCVRYNDQWYVGSSDEYEAIELLMNYGG